MICMFKHVCITLQTVVIEIHLTRIFIAFWESVSPDVGMRGIGHLDISNVIGMMNIRSLKDGNELSFRAEKKRM